VVEAWIVPAAGTVALIGGLLAGRAGGGVTDRTFAERRVLPTRCPPN
jgi:hypothetical protein